jgi:hypothetical protein
VTASRFGCRVPSKVSSSQGKRREQIHFACILPTPASLNPASGVLAFLRDHARKKTEFELIHSQEHIKLNVQDKFEWLDTSISFDCSVAVKGAFFHDCLTSSVATTAPVLPMRLSATAQALDA